MEDDRAIPPPSPTWQALMVEDMVHEGRTGLTEAIVTGPRWAVLFYGHHLLEGLNLHCQELLHGLVNRHKSAPSP